MTGVAAVTGATGFIGRRLVAALVRRQWRVRALARRPMPGGGPVEWVQGTLAEPAALARLVGGADAVIHCAGRVRGLSHRQFLQVNVQGTARLAAAAAAASPPPRFLLISSLAAREPRLSWYARSKFLGEQALARHAGRLRYAVFRPGAVYGPGDREMRPLFRAMRWGVLPACNVPGARFGLLHVDDLADAVLCWIEAEEPPAGTYELDDGTPGGYDLRTVTDVAREVWGHPVYVLPVPVILVRALAGINLRLSRLFHYSPMLTPGKVRELLHPDWVGDNAPLTGLGWRPTRRLRDELPAAVLPVDESPADES